MMAKKPEKVIELAVKGMLPKGPLGRAMIKKLHVYAGAEHDHAAQKPEVLTFLRKVVERRKIQWLMQILWNRKKKKSIAKYI